MSGSEVTGITKEFLENALKQPVERFEASAGSSLGDGYTCAMFKCTVWTKADPENPLHIVVKCFPVNETRQQFLDQGGLFELEIRYYDTIIPELNKFQEDILPEGERIRLPFAPYVYGQYISPAEREALGRPLEPLDNVIIMPDLREKANGPYLVRDRFLGFDLDHFKLVIEGQATLHATSWAYKTRKGKTLTQCFPFLDSNVKEIWKSFIPMIDVLISPALELFKSRPRIREGLEHVQKVSKSVFGLQFGFDLGQAERGHTKDNVLRVPTETVPDEQPWNVLLHGDCWSNNVMFRYDEKTGRPVEAVFIDLQMTREEEMFSDLVYTTYFNPEPLLRRKHLKSLLHVYYDTFTAVCDKLQSTYPPGWSFQEFSRRFRRASASGGSMAPTIGMVLRNPDTLENVDDGVGRKAAENARDSNNAEGDAFSDMSSYFAELSLKSNYHPCVLPRMTAILEDLVEDNVI